MAAKTATGESQGEVLARLRAQIDGYAEGIAQQTARLKKSNTQIMFLQKEVQTQRKKLKFKSVVSNKMFYGPTATKENDDSVLMLLSQLEKRLNSQKINNNESNTLNGKLRNGIDSRRAKLELNRADAKQLKSTFDDLQKDMARIMDLANDTYEERTAYATHTENLKTLNEQERESCEKELLELQNYITEQRALNESLKKGKGVGDGDGGGDASGSGAKTRGNLTSAEEAALKLKMKKMTEATNKHNKRLQATEETITNYEEAFAKLKEVSGITDLGRLVEMFVTQEDQIFSLYNYIQHVNQDTTEWERKISDTVAAMNKHMRAEGNSKDKQNETLSKSKSRKLYLETSNEKMIETFAKNEKDVSLWCQVVQDLFSDGRLLERGTLRTAQNIVDQKKVLKKEYELRTGKKWMSGDDDGRKGQGRKNRKKSGSLFRSKRNSGRQQSEESNLISVNNLLAALSIIQQYHEKVASIDKTAVPLEPHIKPRKEMQSRSININPPPLEKDAEDENEDEWRSEPIKPVDSQVYMKTLCDAEAKKRENGEIPLGNSYGKKRKPILASTATDKNSTRLPPINNKGRSRH